MSERGGEGSARLSAFHPFRSTKIVHQPQFPKELPERHVFGTEDLWMIAEIIDRHLEGKDMALKMNHVNLFFLDVGKTRELPSQKVIKEPHVIAIEVFISFCEWH